MKYTKTWNQFLNEGKKHNYSDYLQSLSVWKQFISKFNQLRKGNRGKSNPDVLKKSTGSIFHEELPHAQFIDEWYIEDINRKWKEGRAKPRPYGDENDKRLQTVEFKGLNEPELGDIMVNFRGYGWLFKPDENFNYKYNSSGAWAYDSNPNMWDDIIYFDNFVKNYVFKFQKDEIPLIFREKLARHIRPNVYDTNIGFKRRKKLPSTDITNGVPAGYKFTK